jgi:hypothetical protein
MFILGVNFISFFLFAVFLILLFFEMDTVRTYGKMKKTPAYGQCQLSTPSLGLGHGKTLI